MFGSVLYSFTFVLQVELYVFGPTQPTHPGAMTQAGLNMGPRHARVLGYAKSFTKKLSKEEMVAQDTDLIGALSLLWHLCLAYLPEEVTAEATEFFERLGYPSLATRNVANGMS